ncbi:putative ribonuclease H-like domain-containing protein [Tanacetum coccineum]|uniref:Ribonuclease H-like domain-containing protein n=1 Tax=Tanacetum coccineum TaxID=301880 RepID=A0ABQ4Z9T6_9ASTR
MDITLTLSPITPLDVQFDTPSPSSPIVGHPIPWNLLETHGDSCLCCILFETCPISQTLRNLMEDMLPLGEEPREKELLVKEILKLVLLKVSRKNNMYSVDMKNIIPKESLTCLVAKATLNESMLWHRRLGHVNFKYINKLFKNNLTRGLPVKRFKNDQTCVACLKGKQHKASSSKDETSDILKNFITEIENLVDKKGIKREYSIARTPQQNGVAERRNRTLIKAARTMLADSKYLLIIAEAVNTAFYVQNRASLMESQMKDSLFVEDKPIIAGDGPKWLFDIDVLTKSMHYVPVVAGTNSNEFVGKEESIGTGHSSKETGSSQDYILMLIWKDGSLFDSSLKNVNNDEPQPFSDAETKDDKGVNKESGIDDQERPKNSTQDVSTAGPSINIASINVNTGSLNINTDSPTVTTAPLKSTHADFFGDETEVDMSNITTTYLVPSTQNTRIHKDHPLDHVIGDVQSSVLTRKMTKTTNEQVARIEAIRLFLAYASFKDFVVYQMDVKSAFLYGKIKEEVYVCQSLGFEDSEFPNRVYKIDKTLFIKRVKSDILLVQVYVDDIIFRSTKKKLCTEFEKLMHKKFQMSYMGELTFFLGLQVTLKVDGIFISQDKYVDEILKKFGFLTLKTASTPMETSKPLLKDAEAKDVDVHLYRLMIGSLMYLTSSRPDIIFVYPKDSPFDLEAYTDSDYVGASLDRKSTTGGVSNFLEQ